MLSLLLPAFALAIGFIPVWLLRRQARAGARDYFVSCHITPPRMVENTSIGATLRIASFAPLFVWGVSGELWPAIVAAVALGCGVALIYGLRARLFAFLDQSLNGNKSVTPHGLLAQHYGGSVAVLTASLGVIALGGLVVLEAFATASLLQPDSLVGREAIFWLLLLAAAAYAIPSGNSGVLHAAQLQLGIFFIGLFGALALLLYLHVSALDPLPPHATVAMAGAAVLCAVWVLWRRSKYIDTSALTLNDGHEPKASRWLRRFERILNVVISVFAVLVVVFVAMQFFLAGTANLLADGQAALAKRPGLPLLGLLTVALTPLLYPLIDVVSWQRLAATARDALLFGVKPDERAATFRSIFRRSAIEGPLIWLIVCILGATAAIAPEVASSSAPLSELVRWLSAQEDDIASLAQSLLWVAVVAMVVPVMSSMLSAGFSTTHGDLLAAIAPKTGLGNRSPAADGVALRGAVAPLFAICLIAALMLVVADLASAAPSSVIGMVAMFVALLCLQLPLVPLVVGALASDARTVSPRWAVAVVAVSTGGGVAAVAIYAATAIEGWLWAAVPICIGAGFALTGLARFSAGRARPA